MPAYGVEYRTSKRKLEAAEKEEEEEMICYSAGETVELSLITCTLCVLYFILVMI